MFYAYILRSLKDGTLYKGSTADLQNRLKYHNAGKVQSVQSTKAHRPWVIHYYEEFKTKKEAIKREHFFKSYQGYLV
jgi:putative endonuclease